MNTPIVSFVNEYTKKEPLRLHMPGHKGMTFLGCEDIDITEIPGADSLFEASGIIRQSEENAGRLFGSRTFYSTEGSSLAIRAMVALAMRHSIAQGKKPLIWAARNAHSTFLSAAALMDCDVEWLYPDAQSSYLSCRITPEQLSHELQTASEKPIAVYVTSPDYLGTMADVAGLAAVCHAHKILLLVDNAHGAYLRFLPASRHPMDLGADLCCDSAHKTLPVLTGGAYLHVSANCDFFSELEVRETLHMFASTSPSYLILQSLDLANQYLDEHLTKDLGAFLPVAERLKRRLKEHGFVLTENEPLKLTIAAKPYGYTGVEMAELLAQKNIIAEFFDPDYVVMLLSPLLSNQMEQLGDALCDIPKRAVIQDAPPTFHRSERIMRIREAALAPFEALPVEKCVGRVLAQPSVGCPPAVPILVSGEKIDNDALQCFRYYGITQCNVVR